MFPVKIVSTLLVLAACGALAVTLVACRPATAVSLPASTQPTAESPATTSPVRTPAPVPMPVATFTPTATRQPPSPTPTLAAGTLLEATATDLLLSQPVYGWAFRMPADWIITDNNGFALRAHNRDETIFLRLQAQRWPADGLHPTDARSYVEHWKHFIYGNIFPLYANGVQLSEEVISPGKLGGPYLVYEFQDDRLGVRYRQLYAAGGPVAALLSTWTAVNAFDHAQPVMAQIVASFELVELSR